MCFCGIVAGEIYRPNKEKLANQVDGGDTEEHTENVQSSDECAGAAQKRARLAVETEVAD